MGFSTLKCCWLQGRVGCADQGNGQAPTLRQDRQGLQILGQPDLPLQDPLPALWQEGGLCPIHKVSRASYIHWPVRPMITCDKLSQCAWWLALLQPKEFEIAQQSVQIWTGTKFASSTDITPKDHELPWFSKNVCKVCETCINVSLCRLIFRFSSFE